jgi:hypothetical protein
MRDKVPGRPVPSKSQWRKLQRSLGDPLNLPTELTQSDGGRWGRKMKTLRDPNSFAQGALGSANNKTKPI